MRSFIRVLRKLFGRDREDDVEEAEIIEAWEFARYARGQVKRSLRFECSMLQAPYEDTDGVLRYRDVTCTDPCDFGTLWERQWLVTDFVKDDECLLLPHVKPSAWESPQQMFSQCVRRGVVRSASLAQKVVSDGGAVAGAYSDVELPDVVGRKSRYDSAIAVQARRQKGETAGRPSRRGSLCHGGARGQANAQSGLRRMRELRPSRSARPPTQPET